ncbi:MAG: cohesin domain-containing protein [Blastocatellia bacterium]
MNTNITIRRILALFLSLCLILPGTALGGDKGKKNFNEGKKYEATQQWDLAAQSYALAVSADPNNPEYRLHYLRALQQASLMYVKRGDALSEQNDYPGAYTAYRAAYQYDQGNEVARIKMERMLEQQKAAAGGLEPVAMTSSGNAKPAAFIEIKNTPRSREATTSVQFNTNFKSVAKTLAKQLDLNIIFDKDVKDDKVDIELTDTTVAKAFDHVLLMTRHTFEQLDRRTILVYQDNATNKPRFEKLYVKTFYLGNITAQQARSAINVILGTSRQAQELSGGGGGGAGGGSTASNVLLVKATPQELQLVQDMLEMLDKNKNEVVLDVEIYEVSHDSMLQIGNQIAADKGVPLEEFAKDKDGNFLKDTLGNPVRISTGTSASLSNLGGLGLAQRGGGGFNSIFPIAGLTAIPSVRGLGMLIGLPPTTLSLLQSRGNSRLLHKTQIHVLDGQQNVTKVGRSVPVRLGQSYGGFGGGGFGNAGGLGGGIGGVGGVGGIGGVGGVGGIGGIGGGVGFGGGFPIDSIQYKDVGLVIDAKPQITNEGYVEIQMKFETSDVLASGSDSNLTPTFTQRSLQTTARIKDGVTSVVAGVNQDSKGESRAGIPVLGMLPILGRLFTAPRQESRQSDIVITVTPHIVRSAGISAKDFLALQAGSGQPGQSGLAPKVEDVVYRAQMEEEQERRLIAAEQAPQQQQNVQLTPNNQVASIPTPQAPRANSQPQIQNASNTNTGAPATPPRDNAPKKRLGNADLIQVQSSGTPQQNQEQTPQQPESSGGASGGGDGVPSNFKEKELADGTVIGPETPVPQAMVRMGVESEETRKKRELIRKQFEEQKKREEEEAKAAAKTKPQAAPQPSDFLGANPKAGKVDPALPATLTRKVSFNLSPAPVRQQMGKNFSLTVEANGQGEMVGANLALQFDEKKLQVKAVRGGDLFGQQPELSWDAKKGVLKIQISNAKKAPVSAKGNVVVIEFAALAEGEAQVSFNNSDTKVNLADKKSASASGSTAQVVITRDAVTSSRQ